MPSIDEIHSRDLEPGSWWKHNKRGTRYEILSIAGSQVDENESDMVVYQGLDDGGLVWVRPVNRFLDKSNDRYRFVRIPGDSSSRQDNDGCCTALWRLLCCYYCCSSGNDAPKIVIHSPRSYREPPSAPAANEIEERQEETVSGKVEEELWA